MISEASLTELAREINFEGKHAVVIFGLFLTVLLQHAAITDVIFETRNFRLIIGQNGTSKGLLAKPSGTEYSFTAKQGQQNHSISELGN